jgi:hypothetical protein
MDFLADKVPECYLNKVAPAIVGNTAGATEKKNTGDIK